jgi:Protein of unknown function (DUF2851)
MELSRRYEQLLESADAKLRESAAAQPARKLTELEIQAHWFAGDFGAEFVSTGGEKIRVVQFGTWNREAGPDFADAAISINGADPVRGSIEIDPDPRDWEHHGHATNPDYESVVLHACIQKPEREFFTRTARNRHIAQIFLDPRCLRGEPPNPQPPAKLGRCSGPLRDMPTEKLRAVLTAAAQFRLQKKAARLARTGGLHGSDEALFQSLAVTLGYKNNKLPFTLIAQRLPLKFLLQAGDDLDALIFGIGGFLGASDFTPFDLETRLYLRGLWDRWWRMRDRFARLVLPSDTWRLAATRPANHPQRRLAAFGQIVRHWKKIRTLASGSDLGTMRVFFENLRDEYWDNHYTLTSKRSPKRMALIGATRAGDMLANVFYPLAILRHPGRWADYAKLPATLVSQRVEIAGVRLLGAHPELAAILKSAVNQQGLLQIYEDFCMTDNSDCANCLFPGQVARWK